uniref:Glycosyl transferase family 25 domain-containing protein n=1 Tax=viral metagenome TaxID=1070528 RepID=A0A6C0E8V8_9ZZZZ
MDFIHKAIYINLTRRTDKRTHIENELTKYGLPFERYDAFEYPDFWSYGCAMSHLGVLKQARDNGYKNVVIFEDDFAFSLSKEAIEEQLTEMFTFKPDFDVCMLSYNLQRSSDTEHDKIYKVVESQSGAGYIVQQHYYDKLISLFEKANQMLLETRQHWIYMNDQSWKSLQMTDNWYCFKERSGHQIPCFSDVSQMYKTNDDW